MARSLRQLASPPPRALKLSGWSLLPLRAFLGFTFCYAGLQKLANPNFFKSSDPAGIYAQLVASDRVSPLHLILGHLLRFATPIGVLIALAEVAVGLGVLLGLWTRIAATGGALLSLTLFLTVSYHASPYYTGADIVFFFAWIPLVLAGAGGVLSMDAAISARVRAERSMGDDTPVTVAFSVIQQVCGQYQGGRCKARRGRPCEPGRCPYLAQRAAGGSVTDADMMRREVVFGGAAAAAAGVAGLVTAGVAAGIGRAVGGAKPLRQPTTLAPSRPSATTTTTTTTTTSRSGGSPSTTTTPKPSGTAIGPAKAVPVGQSAAFSDPKTGTPSLVIQLDQGHFVAYDAVCPHAGCLVGYVASQQIIACPCHGSEFNPGSGDVVQGPAASGLTKLTIAEGSDGQLYVEG